MCGIAGKFNFNGKPVEQTEVLSMLSEIKHRGPDDEGIFLDENIALGHRRLSIIDLSANGHQPMADASQRYRIVFNGEIYNFKELRTALQKDGIIFRSQSDTEVILYLYQKFGLDCAKHLRGMFAFAIWDAEKKELYLARDPLGKKPLKYYHDKNTFIFASELKAILKNPEVEKEIDWQAISEFLTYKYVPAPRTGFRNISKLLPAHYMLVKADGEIVSKKYWDLDFSLKTDFSEKEWQAMITEKLKESVRLRLVSDVPLGAHLSGGIDSSLIVALMAEMQNRPVKTFSIGFKEEKYDERPWARMIAAKYKTDHHEYIIEPDTAEILPELAYLYEEPYADASMLPSYYLSKFTREHVTVALSGDGGDEAFAGYDRYLAARLYFQFRKLPMKRLTAALNMLAYKLSGSEIFYKAARQLSADYSSLADFYLSIVRYFSPAELRALSASLPAIMPLKIERERIDRFAWLDQLLYAGIHTHLPDDLLVKTDIASMANGLEVRSPFLDKELLELSARMPADLKVKGYEKKYILKKIAENYLPREIISRPKQGFVVPLDYWFRGELSVYLEKQILDQDFLAYGFDRNFINKTIKEHRSQKSRNENQLFALLMLGLWLKQWF